MCIKKYLLTLLVTTLLPNNPEKFLWGRQVHNIEIVQLNSNRSKFPLVLIELAILQKFFVISSGTEVFFLEHPKETELWLADIMKTSIYEHHHPDRVAWMMSGLSG